MNQTIADAGQASKSPSRRQMLVFVGVIAIFVLALLIQTYLYFARPATPKIPVLTLDEFNRAKQTWESRDIKNYNLDLGFGGGSNHEEVHLEVRDGKVTVVTRNGKPPAQQRAREEWTVPNQFEMIAQDLEKSRTGFGTRQGVEIELHGEFDPELGHPKQYERRRQGPLTIAFFVGREAIRSRRVAVSTQPLPVTPQQLTPSTFSNDDRGVDQIGPRIETPRQALTEGENRSKAGKVDATVVVPRRGTARSIRKFKAPPRATEEVGRLTAGQGGIERPAVAASEVHAGRVNSCRSKQRIADSRLLGLLR